MAKSLIEFHIFRNWGSVELFPNFREILLLKPGRKTRVGYIVLNSRDTEGIFENVHLGTEIQGLNPIKALH